MELKSLSSEPILDWLEENFNQKVQNLKNEQNKVLEAKELEFKNDLIAKGQEYRDVKFESIMNENKININNLLQKFRYNKDLLIEKKINEVVEIAKQSIKELIDTETSFLIFYYSTLINFISKNFPEISKIYCPLQTEKYFSQFKIDNNKIKLISSDEINIGIIGEIGSNNKLIHFSPEIMYNNNEDEIRKVIFNILREP